MSAKLRAALANILTVALLVSTVVRAQPDQASSAWTQGLLPAPGAPASPPVAETPATSPETPGPSPTAKAPVPKPEAEASPMFEAQQLDQLLAPIALYPDALLAQILMAATYPLEVVKADRWLQDPSHASLRGDQLASALEAEEWDLIRGPRSGLSGKRAVASCTRLLGSFWKACCKPSSGADLVQSLVDRSFLQRPVVLEFSGDL